MQPLLERQPAAAGPADQPLVEIVVPVHNEQRVLEASIRRLHGYLATSFPFPFRITIADNASDAARQISAWVQQNFTAASVGGATVYDLTTTPGASPTAAASPTWPP